MKKLLIIFFLLFSLTSCQSQQTALTTEEHTNQGYGITILYHDINTFLSLKDLADLPMQSISMDDRMQEGPFLSDVLKTAGIKNFSLVHLISGSEDIVLTKEQIDNETILDFTNHGTVKLATTHMDKNKWVKDVTKIEVK